MYRAILGVASKTSGRYRRSSLEAAFPALCQENRFSQGCSTLYASLYPKDVWMEASSLENLWGSQSSVSYRSRTQLKSPTSMGGMEEELMIPLASLKRSSLSM